MITHIRMPIYPTQPPFFQNRQCNFLLMYCLGTMVRLCHRHLELGGHQFELWKPLYLAGIRLHKVDPSQTLNYGNLFTSQGVRLHKLDPTQTLQWREPHALGSSFMYSINYCIKIPRLKVEYFKPYNTLPQMPL